MSVSEYNYCAKQEGENMIDRKQVGERMSQIVIHNDTIYLAGQVARDLPEGSAADQTRVVLSQIDGLLAEAGSDKSKLLAATICLASISDYDDMNRIWDEWIVSGKAPARACIEARLAKPSFLVEILVIAAR